LRKGTRNALARGRLQQFDVLVPQEDHGASSCRGVARSGGLDVHIKLPAMARLREAWQPWLVSNERAARCIAD